MDQMEFRQNAINKLGGLNLPHVFEQMIRGTDCQVVDDDGIHEELLLASSQFCDVLVSLVSTIRLNLISMSRQGCQRCNRLTENGRCPHCFELMD